MKSMRKELASQGPNKQELGICPNCGAKGFNGMFCSRCGYEVKISERRNQAPESEQYRKNGALMENEEPSEYVVYVEPDETYGPDWNEECPNCGSPDFDGMWCDQCGFDMSEDLFEDDEDDHW